MNAAPQPRLFIVPCNIEDAIAFIKLHHRHLPPPHRSKFAVAVADETGKIRGVATVSWPIARFLNDGWTLEVSRCCTDGCPNACSALYAAAWRVTKALGYKKLITYTLATEPGTSLKASGWKCLGKAGGRPWNHPSRPRVDLHPLQPKLRWEIENF